MARDAIRFHRELWFPPDEFDHVNILTGKYHINPSNHARDKARNNKYGVRIDIPDGIYVTRDMVFEVGIENEEVTIICFRAPHVDCFPNADSSNWDLCVALNVDDRIARSVWPNEAHDSHTTLDASNYGGPDDWPC